MKRPKDPIALAHELRQRLAERGLTSGTAIAKATGLGQSQVHRNLYGSPRRVSRTLLALCKYAKIDAYERASDPRNSLALMEALAQVWDGSEAHARRLAKLLFAHRQAHM
ncbi:helix-turn-helix domain-containing protein [Dyella koreensis]|uniref:Helix-turn-helix transcriptional regulator n=2 Tax=Dyella koreensis TaxID=311235 RepID=A0ABW8KAV6_9GAMM